MKLVTTDQIINYLQSKDDLFFKLADCYGLIEIELYNDLFSSIVFHIVGQMLSLKAAHKIYERFEKLCNYSIDPKTITALDSEAIKNCGMSSKKVKWIKEFAQKCLNNEIELGILEKLEDKKAVEYLMKINGVGEWTAEMIMMFSLGRANIFSFKDIALKNGIAKAKHLKEVNNKKFEQLKRKYSPYCSYAALYFYKCNDDVMYK